MKDRAGTAEPQSDAQLEIGHVLFMDIVGFSKLLVDEQRAVSNRLNQIVRNTDQFRAAEMANKLIRLPTGDGMALVFYTGPEAPARCAIEISRARYHRLLGEALRYRGVFPRDLPAGAGVLGAAAGVEGAPPGPLQARRLTS